MVDPDAYWEDYWTALSQTCTPEQLEQLASSPNPHAREVAVANPQCPSRVLHLASQDLEAGVRQAVAERLDCPLDILRRLVDDPDPLVHAVAIQHPILSEPGSSIRAGDIALL
jgi:hypothetical protein